MPREKCEECDYPGNGVCRVCHGTGRSVGKEVSGIVWPQDDYTRDGCGGNEKCSSCGGEGYIEY